MRKSYLPAGIEPAAFGLTFNPKAASSISRWLRLDQMARKQLNIKILARKRQKHHNWLIIKISYVNKSHLKELNS